MMSHSMLGPVLLFWVALLVTITLQASVIAAPLAGRGALKSGATLKERAGKIHFTTNSVSIYAAEKQAAERAEAEADERFLRPQTYRQDVHPLPRGRHAYSAALPVQLQAERGHKVVVSRGSARLKRISMEHGEGQDEGGVVSG